MGALTADIAEGAEMFDDAARRVQSRSTVPCGWRECARDWRIENADDPGRDMQWIGHRSQNSISSSALVGLAVSIPVI